MGFQHGPPVLQPCPFCGAFGVGIRRGIERGWVVGCRSCGAEGPNGAGQVEASSLWGRYARDDAYARLASDGAVDESRYRSDPVYKAIVTRMRLALGVSNLSDLRYSKEAATLASGVRVSEVAPKVSKIPGPYPDVIPYQTGYKASPDAQDVHRLVAAVERIEALGFVWSIKPDGPGWRANAYTDRGAMVAEAWSGCDHMERCDCPPPTAAEAMAGLADAVTRLPDYPVDTTEPKPHHVVHE